MAYPKLFKNADTGKTFRLDKNSITFPFTGFEIKAVETGLFLFSKPDWGSVNWEVMGTKLLLHTIANHPEKGTGLGGLLMYLIAKEALAAGCDRLEILSAAQSEREFYYMMGCALDMSAISSFNQAEFTVEGWQDLCKSCPVAGTPASILEHASANAVKRWGVG